MATKEDKSESKGPDLQECVDHLGDLAETGRGLELSLKLEGWSELDRSEREELRSEVHELIDRAESQRKALELLTRLASAHPATVGCLTGFLAAIGIATLVLYLDLPLVERIFALMAALIVASWIYHWAATAGRKRWIQTRMLPGMERFGIEITDVLPLLDDLIENVESPYKLRQFAKTYKDLLEDSSISSL